MISHATTKGVLRVMLKHLSRTQLQAIVKDLQEVPGNKSFRDTMTLVAKTLLDSA